MRANDGSFRRGVGFWFGLRLSSLFPTVVVFLNGIGGGEQILKGWLVQSQIGSGRVRRRQFGPVQRHGDGGEDSPGWGYCRASLSGLKPKNKEGIWGGIPD
jgi:hypothetical protein